MVTLIDGTQVPSDSEEWRFETEARTVLNMPNKALRQGFLEKVGQRRGDDARIRLETKILEVWQHRQKLAADAQKSA